MAETTNSSSNVKPIGDSPGIQKDLRDVSYPAQIPEEENQFLKLVNTLQCTLDIGKLLELYDDELKALVPHDGFRYENSVEKINMEFGRPDMHNCSYNMVLLDKNLGNVIFYRSSKFSNDEIDLLENCVAALIYPLRNSLLYKRAIETAHRDPITDLNNRAAMDSSLDTELDFANRHSLPLSILMLDIDRFKHINDTYGHIGGDQVLKYISDCLHECVRLSDVLFRYGGEEFVVILRNTNEMGAELLANRIRQAIEDMECKYNNHLIRVTASIGVALMKKGDSKRSLLERADAALYEAKAQGRNRVITAK